MVDVSAAPEGDQIAQLQATIEAIQRQLESLGARPPKRRVWRRRASLAGAVVLACAMVTGVAAASAPGNPADVSYIYIGTPHKLLTNTSIAKGATNSQVVVGATTTIPSDATSVQMNVSIKSTVAGTLSVYPTDYPSSATADVISFPAGNVVITRFTRQSPGLSGKVSFTNNGTATATVSVTLTGYSTQTAASSISGSGGSAGQVLTNTGSGASWQTLPAQNAANFSGIGGAIGQVLTNTSSGVQWQTPRVDTVLVLPPNPITAQTATITIGTFFKDNAASAIKLTWTGHVAAVTPSGGGGCYFQLRIDGYVDDHDGGLAELTYSSAHTSLDQLPVGVTAFFARLGAGSHTVAISYYGYTSTCNINAGNFTDEILVEEQN